MNTTEKNKALVRQFNRAVIEQGNWEIYRPNWKPK